MLREALALNTVVKMGLFFSGIVSDAKSDKIPPILFINLDGKNESITSPSFSVSFFVGLCINKLKQKAMQSLKEKRIRFNKIMMKSKFIFVLVRNLKAKAKKSLM